MRWLAVALVVLPLVSQGAPRSRLVVAEFKRHHPCPSTSDPRVRCPGYVVDHITPLCAGGADQADNMQWQTVDAARLKDRQEWRLCRDLKLSPALPKPRTGMETP